MRWVLAAVLALAPAPLRAEVTPQPGPGDPHIQTVAYDPAQVVGLHVAMGFATTVQFPPDERIETVTLGDSAAWLVQTNKRADSLIVKPLAGGNTNLTVLTDTRAYNFTLYTAWPGEGVQPYLLSFTFPAPPVPEAPRAGGRYTLSGDKALWPAEMSDDGAFTRIRWREGAAQPAIYRDDEAGRALLNGAVRDGAYVVEGVYARLLFVSGKARARARRENGERP